MPSDLRLDLALLAALCVAVQPAMAAQPRTMWLCTPSGPVPAPGKPIDMPTGCHACVLCGRADEEREEEG